MKNRRKWLLLALLIVAFLLLWPNETAEQESGAVPAAGQLTLLPQESVPAAAPEQPSAGGKQTAEPTEKTLDEHGIYDSKEDVALFLHLYGHLPDNYITKTKARKLGWNGGSLEPYAPGMCIGGGGFGNNEGLLPPGNYKECDIDTLYASSRGAKRIIWSDDGRIYYTDDHYETFEQLYGGTP